MTPPDSGRESIRQRDERDAAVVIAIAAALKSDTEEQPVRPRERGTATPAWSPGFATIQ